MQASLMQKEAQLKHTCRARDQARQDYEKAEQKCTGLETNLDIALKNDKDDIGRMLIKKLKPLTAIQSNRRQHIDRLSQDIKQLREHIAQQQSQYENLHQKTTEYFHRADQQRWQNFAPQTPSGFTVQDVSVEEIELELLQRKEAIKGGATS